MTLPISGPISLGDIRTEFGGVASPALSHYYSIASGVPSSGPISLGDFHGKSSATHSITPAGIFGSASVIGYQPSPAFGSISPTSYNGRTIELLHDRNDGASPVHTFSFRLSGTGVQAFFNTLVLTDKNGIVRTFRTDGGGSFPITSFISSPFMQWTWNCDAVTTALFMNVGVAYPLTIS